MSERASIVSSMAERYAGALFDLARDAGEIDAVAANLQHFEALLAESPELVRLVRSPVFTSDEQTRAIDAVLTHTGITGLAASFIKVVASNRRLFAVPDMIRGYRALMAAHRNEVPASVVSAEPLSDAQIADLKAALGHVTGKAIRLDAKVDRSLIGGLVMRMGSRMIDTSLKTKLNQLKIALKEVG